MSENVPKYTDAIKPIRTLLNPKFEGYKLKVFDERSQLKHFQLPPPAITIPKIPTKSKLSYKEIQSRIHFNHLFKGFEIDKGKGICFYFDSENFVVLAEYDPATSNVVTHRLVKIQQPSDYSGNVEGRHLNFNYPSLRALSPNLLLVTNGFGTIFLVQIKNDNASSYSGEILYQMEFKGKQESDINNNIPCVLLDGRIVRESEDDLHVLFLVYNTVLNQETRGTLFDISLLRLSMSPQYGMEIIHVLRGPDIPFYCNIEFNGAGYVIGGNLEYEVVYKSSNHNDTVEPMYFEYDQKSEKQEMSTTVQDDKKVISPYIWTQTSSDVTICFQLPQGTPKTAVHCNFSQTHLSLTINLGDNPNISPELPPIPCYAFTHLFDLIDPSSSLWTIEPAVGLLTLHLEKHNHNTRWSHVFQHDDGVFETLDPNEFAEFRERLEKFTYDNSEQFGQLASKPLQHPIGYEIEESIDYEEKSSTFLWVDREGNLIAKASGGNEYLCRQFEYLEKTEISNNISLFPSVCLKSDVDGIVYSIGHPIDSSKLDISPLVITHIATFNAFAFVQASKRERRFSFHDPKNRFVIILEGDHRAFIYKRHEVNENYDEQSVVELAFNSNDDSEIIGVQMASIENAHVIVLKSNSMIIIKLL
ncbi:hypothetical protein C1645_805491 [Glomus cerebriforme]|uniref:NudC domain-containing protein 1 n=1 Tax=Glomus cerebriforme TaxID=658196 RepID=A0A397T1V2_9GLOM|nr:hypothetical protein C1645_805491 [Glomus cerebriforme]